MPKELQDKLRAVMPRERVEHTCICTNGSCIYHFDRVYNSALQEINLESIHKVYQDYFKDMIEARDTRMIAYYKSLLEGFEGGYPKDWDDFFNSN